VTVYNGRGQVAAGERENIRPQGESCSFAWRARPKASPFAFLCFGGTEIKIHGLWAVYISAIGMAICYTLHIVRHAHP
jgi:hypothetical protein